MLQGLAQFRISILQFLKEADILDSNDGLIGKGLQQRDLFLSERTNLHPMNRDRADRRAFSEHRRRQQRANAKTSPARRSSSVFWFCHQIMNVDCSAVEYSLAHDMAAS